MHTGTYIRTHTRRAYRYICTHKKGIQVHTYVHTQEGYTQYLRTSTTTHAFIPLIGVPWEACTRSWSGSSPGWGHCRHSPSCHRISYSVVFSPEVVPYPLYFLACEVCQLTTAQGEATHKLVLSDDSTPQLVVVLEELRGANLILVNNVLDPSKYILNRGDRRVLWE